MAVWATANMAAPRVADNPHTAIFTIRFPFPHSWPRSRDKAASRPARQQEGGVREGGRSGDMEGVKMIQNSG